MAAVGEAGAFARGRDLAAWLGLVPKQMSTGGKAKLLGISERGNTYLRTLLIHLGREPRSEAGYVGADCEGRIDKPLADGAGHTFLNSAMTRSS